MYKQKNMIKKNKATILLYTLIILSVIAILVQQLVRSCWVGTYFNSRMVAKEQARALAMTGLNLAIAQLIKVDKPEYKKTLQQASPSDKASQDGQGKRSEQGKSEEQPTELKDFLKLVLPHLNKWQTFNLTEKVDGIDGQVKFCITCENGKININKSFDFKKGEFKEEVKNLLAGLHMKGTFREGDILNNLTKFLKEKKKPLQDISELVDVEGFEKLDLFYSPPKHVTKKQEEKPNRTIFLQDLFTTWSDSEEMELLFLSDSALAVFGLRRPQANDAQRLKDRFENLIKLFDPKWGADWKKHWKFIQSMYGNKSPHIEKYAKILSKQFGPKVYSVLSCGVVQGVEQYFLAVIKEVVRKEKKKKESKEKKDATKTFDEEKKEKPKTDFVILRTYWM
jgi:hypothetical protein